MIALSFLTELKSANKKKFQFYKQANKQTKDSWMQRRLSLGPALISSWQTERYFSLHHEFSSNNGSLKILTFFFSIKLFSCIELFLSVIICFLSLKYIFSALTC